MSADTSFGKLERRPAAPSTDDNNGSGDSSSIDKHAPSLRTISQQDWTPRSSSRRGTPERLASARKHHREDGEDDEDEEVSDAQQHREGLLDGLQEPRRPQHQRMGGKGLHALLGRPPATFRAEKDRNKARHYFMRRMERKEGPEEEESMWASFNSVPSPRRARQL